MTIEDAVRCPRYSARVIRGVKVGPSPDWMVERLAAIGQRSINNIVDVTNYILFLFGQPLHAFDLDKLKGADGCAHVVIREAEDGAKFTTLDERGAHAHFRHDRHRHARAAVLWRSRASWVALTPRSPTETTDILLESGDLRAGPHLAAPRATWGLSLKAPCAMSAALTTTASKSAPLLRRLSSWKSPAAMCRAPSAAVWVSWTSGRMSPKRLTSPSASRASTR